MVCGAAVRAVGRALLLIVILTWLDHQVKLKGTKIFIVNCLSLMITRRPNVNALPAFPASALRVDKKTAESTWKGIFF